MLVLYALAEHYGISFKGKLLKRRLIRHPPAHRAADLVEKLGLSRSQVYKSLEYLEKHGFLRTWRGTLQPSATKLAERYRRSTCSERFKITSEAVKYAENVRDLYILGKLEKQGRGRQSQTTVKTLCWDMGCHRNTIYLALKRLEKRKAVSISCDSSRARYLISLLYSHNYGSEEEGSTGPETREERTHDIRGLIPSLLRRVARIIPRETGWWTVRSLVDMRDRQLGAFNEDPRPSRPPDPPRHVETEDERLERRQKAFDDHRKRVAELKSHYNTAWAEGEIL